MKDAGSEDWKYHLSLVVKYYKQLARFEKADEEIVELAAFLHDIGRIKFDDENHEITGAFEAEKILQELNYPKGVIEEVKHCVKTHRGNYPINSKAAEIIRDADAISHFDIIPVLVQIGLRKHNGYIEKAVNRVDA